MRTATNRISLQDLPDVFGPRELARFLGTQQQTGYDLVKRDDFPAMRLGKKILIPKQPFLRWLEAQGQMMAVEGPTRQP